MRRFFVVFILVSLISCQQNNKLIDQEVAPLGHPSYNCNVSAYFPDGNLEAAVKKQLGVASDEALSCEKLKTLEILDASNRNIKDLTGLQNAWRLKHLNVQRNQISNIDVVASLYQLQILDIGDNQVEDISAITKITQLRELHFWQNQITDLSPVTKLTRLYLIKLWNNQVADLSPLQNLKRLKYLDLSRNHVSNIDALIKNTRIDNDSQINLIRNRLDLSVNSQVTIGINTLKARGVQLRLDHQEPNTPIEPTDKCVDPVDMTEGLRRIIALNSNFNTEEARRIFNEGITCSDLLKLTLVSNDFYNRSALLKGLQYAINLESFAFDAPYGPPEFSYLTNLPKLKRFHLGNVEMLDISFVSKLKTLESLSLNRVQFLDITPVTQLTQLKELYLAQNQVTDIRFLKDFTNLRVLDLSQNQVEDITSLVQNTALSGSTVTIDLRNNFLDLSEGSEDLTNIEILLKRGVSVEYEPQIPSASLGDCKDPPSLSDGIQLDMRYKVNGYSDSFTFNRITCFDVVKQTVFDDYQGFYTEINEDTDFKGLEYMLNLKTIEISYEINDLSFLNLLTSDQLETINLRGSELKNIELFATYDLPTNLNLSRNLITDISALVSNNSLGEGDYINLLDNCLDLSDNSDDFANINKLFSRGVQVDFYRQRDCSFLLPANE